MMITIVALDFNLENMTIGQAAHHHHQQQQQQQQQQQKNKQGPSLQIPYTSLKIELVTEGLSFPTSMEFIDDNNIWFCKRILEQYILSQMVFYRRSQC